MGENKVKKYVSNNSHLMEEWDHDKNHLLGYIPESISEKSNKKVWWQCSNGHQWEMSPSQRSRGQACPYCSNRRVWKGYNDLSTTHPKIVEQWDTEKNVFSPEEVTYGSNKMAWWKCPLGHRYQMTIHQKISRNTLCPVCSGHKTLPGVNDFATYYPDIAKEWHPTKNGDLLPSMLSKKNSKKVWWQCAIGHEWQASIHDRADGTGCPFCSAKRNTSFAEQAVFFYIKKLFPDAMNRYKDIFNNGMELDIYIPSIKYAIEFDGAFWHSSEDSIDREYRKFDLCRQNGIKLIRVKEETDALEKANTADITYIIGKRKNSTELSQVIQAILNSIDPEANLWTRKNPYKIHSSIIVDLNKDANEIRSYLAPIHNSLVELRPDLVLDWNFEKNGKLSPNIFGINSNDSVWWKCRVCGHEWKTTIIQRGGKRRSGCPKCTVKQRGKAFTESRVKERGSLAENNPALAKEWHPSKNSDLSPFDITEKRFDKVWWLCSRCGHEWEASPLNRSKGIGCPACSGRVPRIGENDLKTLFPTIAREWHYEKNSPFLPEQFLPKSGKKVWWKCSKCNNEWETIIRTRTVGHNCPKCAKLSKGSMSKYSDN